MKTIEIKGSGNNSTILIGEKLQNLEKYIPAKSMMVITDTNVWDIYHDKIPDCHVIKIGTGEKEKTIDTVCRIYEKLVEAEADRSSFLVGIGGGIVCDITGFVASTYMRGLRFGFVSSTLLSQVDASVGGKNGVNFKGFKNMVGVFNQPEFVICDIDLLKTLPPRELANGFAEIVKHGAIADINYFNFIEENYSAALDLDKSILERLVHDSVMIKASVVNRDEKEKGERRKLNFGHTLGHAIEKTTGVHHGEAISAGMAAAAALSAKKGLLPAKDAQRINRLLDKLQLPISITGPREALLNALKKDKKREGNHIHFILLNGLGNAIVKKLSIKELEAIL